MRINTGLQVMVTATERWYTDIRAGRAFARGGIILAAAGQYGHVQLFNPLGSGVSLVVRAAYAAAGAASPLDINIDNTARATLDGGGFNLLSGAAAGNGVFRRETNAAIQGTVVAQISNLTNTWQPITPDWGFELGEGEGLTFALTTVNTNLFGMFWWTEM